MLDDLKLIAQRDKSDAFGVAEKQSQQLKFSDFSTDDINYDKPKNVVVGGMGGSALAATICKAWWNDELDVSFDIVRTYSVPAYVDSSTLFIASSYSGNTEETVSAFEDAIAKGAKCIVMASGGKLQEMAEENNFPYIAIPSGLQPRMAVLYGVKILSAIFDKIELTNDSAKQLEELVDWLSSEAKNLAPTSGTSENLAKQIAEKIVGKTGVVYSGPVLTPAAYKWKISLNESSKNVAFCNEFSEFNHNEFMGWTSHPTEKVYGVIQLRSNLDHAQIKRRFDISSKLLSGKMPAPIDVEVKGELHIAQLLWAIQLGDFVSLYLAMLNNVDPTPVDLIEKLKEELK